MLVVDERLIQAEKAAYKRGLLYKETQMCSKNLFMTKYIFAETNELLLHEHKACELFNLVYSGGLVPMLPNRSWSIHFMEVPVRCIVISKMMIRFEVESGLTPVQIKQV